MALFPSRDLTRGASVFLAVAAVAVLLPGLLRSSGVRAAGQEVKGAQDATAPERETTPRGGPAATPVLVELFTSEGCSSCPPADAVLERLDREQPVAGAEIIVLSEHVDYWDRLGWKDRFSSPQVTERQKEYQTFFGLDDVFTPQIVVNGAVQLNGSDEHGIESAVGQAIAKQELRLEFANVAVQGDRISFALKGGQPALPGYVDVYAAVVDAEDSTEVRRGENQGRTLHHAGVVRTFGRVGSSWRTKALGERPFTLSAAGLDGPGDMRLVVFAQKKTVGPVMGVASCSFRRSPTRGPAGSSSAPCPGLVSSEQARASGLSE